VEGWARCQRPSDVIGNAVKVMRIATGEEQQGYGDNWEASCPRVSTRVAALVPFHLERRTIGPDRTNHRPPG
jgi:hypothetical protein